MLKAISRYGPRVLPNTEQLISDCKRRGEMVTGPHIAAFEEEFARYLGGGRAISASFGRMAFYYILKAMELPAGSEIIIPALTFWVVPEMARVAGLRPIFVDVNPRTFNIDPDAFESAISTRTRAVVPTHLYGLPCDMDPILRIAHRHGLKVIEDCAHALGATYRGIHTGALGDASFFSFQTLKPLNTYGGGMAYTTDAVLARKIAALAGEAPHPDAVEVSRRLRIARLQRILTYPSGFTFSMFPVLWGASWFGARPDVYLWEKVRSLDPLPERYNERFANVQAALGLAGLARLDEWNARTRTHARFLDIQLTGLDRVVTPHVPSVMSHIYYQYCVYVPDRDQLVRNCIREGLDIETLHVDVCSVLPLFNWQGPPCSGAEQAATAVQIPVYESLSAEQMESIGTRLKRSLSQAERAPLPVRGEHVR